MRIGILLSFLLFALNAHAQVSVSPSMINFGTVDVQRPSLNRETFWVNNYGDKPLQLRVQAWSCGRDFQVDDYCNYVPAYGSCMGNITFRPSYPGSFSCDISIEDWSGAGMMSQTLWVRGTAYKQ